MNVVSPKGYSLGLFFICAIFTMMKKTITKAYIFLVQALLAFIFSFRIYYLWSKAYSFIFVKKNIRDKMPMLHSEVGTDSIQIPLDRVTQVPYVADGAKELWDVCLPPGVVESRIKSIESGEEHDKGAMDCDDYARYMANSIESQHNPLLLSVLCIDDRELKHGVFPKFPGHMVCILNNDPCSGNIYHVGNWNQIKSPYGDILGARDFTHYGYSNLGEMVADLTRSMTGGTGKTLAWIIMDKDLNVCMWGMGASAGLFDIFDIDLQYIRSKTILG